MISTGATQTASTSGIRRAKTMKKQYAEYIKAIEAMLKIRDFETVNIANHRALETGLIDLDTFQKAACYLVGYKLKEMEWSE